VPTKSRLARDTRMAGTNRLRSAAVLVLAVAAVFACVQVFEVMGLGSATVSSVGAHHHEDRRSGVIASPREDVARQQSRTDHNALQQQPATQHAPYIRRSGPTLLEKLCGQWAEETNDVSNSSDSFGSSHTSDDSTSSAEFARVQQIIYDSQHPTSCSEERTMQWVGAFDGFTAIGVGGHLSTLSLVLGLAVVRGQVSALSTASCSLRGRACVLRAFAPLQSLHEREPTSIYPIIATNNNNRCWWWQTTAASTHSARSGGSVSASTVICGASKPRCCAGDKAAGCGHWGERVFCSQ
jgi:hypothetical protein